MQETVSGKVINAADLLSGVKLQVTYTGAPPPPRVVPEDEDEVGEGSHLKEVAEALRDSFYSGSWAMTAPEGGAVSTAGVATARGSRVGLQQAPAVAAGVAPEIYTAALRAVLLEFGEAPSSTLPARLRAADALAALLGVSHDAHEALLVRAVTANENIVNELLSQAQALRTHRCGLTARDFVTHDAYEAWRHRALRAVRAVLLGQQAMAEYNALLEVSLLEARELEAPGSKSGSGFMCCFKPDVAALCPYAWAHLAVPSGSAPVPGTHAAAALGARTQRTQVLAETGPFPSWQAALQPMTLTDEQSELRFKVVQCSDPVRLQPSVSKDPVLGVTGLKVAGLQPAVTQQVVLPLYVPPHHAKGGEQGGGTPQAKSPSSSMGAPAHASDTEPNIFPRQVVYNPRSDVVEGARGLDGAGRLVLRLRYVLERRTRCVVPGEAEFCSDDGGGEAEEARGSASSTGVNKRLSNATSSATGMRGRSGMQMASQPWDRPGSGMAVSGSQLSSPTAAAAAVSHAAEALESAVKTVVTGATAAADYLGQLGLALAQGLTDNPLASAAAKNLFASKFKLVQITLLAEPVSLPCSPASAAAINPYTLIKQLAAALAAASRKGGAWQGSVDSTLGALSLLPVLPDKLVPLLLSPSKRRVFRDQQALTAEAAQHQHQGRMQRELHSHKQIQPQASAAKRNKGLPPPVPVAIVPPSAPTVEEVEVPNGLQDLWSLLTDAMVRPFLPLGTGLGVLLRAGALLQVRAETLVLLVMRYMLDDWPLNKTLKRRVDGTTGGAALAGRPTGEPGGGAQDYLSAVRTVWEKCLSWHAQGTLTNDETEGVKGIMGLLLGSVLPALERHYTVFVGQEGAVCFTMLLEMVGWAWTWDPRAPIPFTLLCDYLKDAATSTMKKDFRPSVATITQDIEALVEEVHSASDCLHRDRAIQGAMPGLKGFAATNAAVRYELLVDHLEALVLYQPGNSLEAMQAMFQLEVALLEHHRLLLSEGFALPLAPPPVPRHLLPQARRLTQQELASKLLQPLPVRAAPAEVAAGEFSESGFERLGSVHSNVGANAGCWERGLGGSSMQLQGALGGAGASDGVGRDRQSPLGGRRSGSSSQGGGRVGPTVVLWDWESTFIEEICRWVKAGVTELYGQMSRLVAAETWQAVSKHDQTARSALELSRLMEVHLMSWLEAACGGSDARRLHVGVLITACLMHLLYEYMVAASLAWEKELNTRSSIFTPGGGAGGSKALNSAAPSSITSGHIPGHRARRMSSQAQETGYVPLSVPSQATLAPSSQASSALPSFLTRASLPANLTHPDNPQLSPFAATASPPSHKSVALSVGGGGGPVPFGPFASFIPSMSAASAPALVRVVSLAVGMAQTSAGLPGANSFLGPLAGGVAGSPLSGTLATGGGGGGPEGGAGRARHQRSSSRSTAFASTQAAGNLLDVMLVRDAAEAALAAQPGVCLSPSMCVIRATLLKVQREAHDIGAHLLLRLVAPHLPSHPQPDSSRPNTADLRVHAVSRTDSSSSGDEGHGRPAAAGLAAKSAISLGSGTPHLGGAWRNHQVGSTSLKVPHHKAGGWGWRTNQTGAKGRADEDDVMPSRHVPAEPPPMLEEEREQQKGPGGAKEVCAKPAWGQQKKQVPQKQQPAPPSSGEQGGGEAAWGRKRGSASNKAAPPRHAAAAGTRQAGAEDCRHSNGGGANPSPIDADTHHPIFNYVAAWWHELARRHAGVVTSMISSYSVSLRSSLVSLMVASCGVKPGDPVRKEILQGLMTGLDDELGVMREGLGGEVVLVAELAGAMWRASMSSLQLLVLNQAGFRPLVEEECELLRQLLTSLQQLYEDEAPRLTQGAAANPIAASAAATLPLDLKLLPDPGYPALLEAQLRARLGPPALPRQLTAPPQHSHTHPPPDMLHPGLLASLDMLPALAPQQPGGAPPPNNASRASSGGGGGSALAGPSALLQLAADPSSQRGTSGDYCAALLQLACAPTGVLQDLFRAQEASLLALQPAQGTVYLQLSPQQLPMLDLLRLLRARRKAEPAAAAWADTQLKENLAMVDKVLFGLVRTERVMAEFKCVLAGASRFAGRLYMTPSTLCFTTMLDADAKALTDTTLSVLREKVVSVSAGAEPGSLVLTTRNHDILAFTGFVSSSERERLTALLLSPAALPAPPPPQLTAAQQKPAAHQHHYRQQQQQQHAANSSKQPQGQGTASGSGAGAGPTGRASGATAAATSAPAQQQQQQQQSGHVENGVKGSASAAASTTPAAAATGPTPSCLGAAAGRMANGATATSMARTAAATTAAAAAAAAAATASSSMAVNAGSGDGATRRPPSRDPWAAREVEAGSATSTTPPPLSPGSGAASASAAVTLAPSGSAAATAAQQPPSQAAGLVVAAALGLSTSHQGASVASAAAERAGAAAGGGSSGGWVGRPSASPPLMTVPCSLYGLVKDRPGVLALYQDRLEFVGADHMMVHCVALADVAAITQQPALMGGNRLVVKVDNDAAVGAGVQLQFTGLSDMMIASLKQSIIDLT